MRQSFLPSCVMIAMTLSSFYSKTAQNTNQPPFNGIADTVYTLAFSPDNKILASGSCSKFYVSTLNPTGATRFCTQGDVRLWDAVSGQLIVPPLAVHRDIVTELEFSPSGKIMASIGYDRGILLWDTNTWQQIDQPLANNPTQINKLAFSPDSTMVAWASNEITVWNIATWQLVGRFLVGNTTPITAVAFSPDGKTLAVADTDIRFWDIGNGQQTGPTLTGDADAGAILHLAFSPDGTKIASLTGTTVRLWEVASGRSINQLLTFGKALYLKFINGGAMLAFFASHGGETWDLTTWKQHPIGFSLPTFDVNVASLSDDGRLLATGGCAESRVLPEANSVCTKGEIYMFEALTGQQVSPS